MLVFSLLNLLQCFRVVRRTGLLDRSSDSLVSVLGHLALLTSQFPRVVTDVSVYSSLQLFSFALACHASVGFQHKRRSSIHGSSNRHNRVPIYRIGSYRIYGV